MPIGAMKQEPLTPRRGSGGLEKPVTAFVETQWPAAGRMTGGDLNLDHLRTRLKILRKKTAGLN